MMVFKGDGVPGLWIRQWHSQPVFVSALGIVPLTANSVTVCSAFVIALAWTVVFILSSITISGLRKLVPHAGRLPFILLVTSTWVSLADIFLQTFLYEMRMTLDIYIPLIALNSLVIMLLEEKMLRMPVAATVKPALACSAAVVFIVLSVGLLREALASGYLLTDFTMLPLISMNLSLPVFPRDLTMSVFGTAAGAFIVIGCVMALVNYLYGCNTRG